jgi:ribosome-associated protein
MTLHIQKEIRPEVQPLDLALKILEACSDAKARDLTLLDVSGVFDLASFFVIVSGRSDRQVQGIANRVAATIQDECKVSAVSCDGYDQGHWVLMDYGDVVVHIFYEPMRDHYDLERLWKDAARIPLPEGLHPEVRRDAA